MPRTGAFARWLSDYEHRKSVGSRLRARRIAPLLEMIERVFADHGRVRLIDVGGTEQYWNVVPRQYLDDHKVTITIVNLPGTTAAEDHGPFVFADGDGCNLAGFADRSFDIGHSNSVVEHVGDWERMVLFAKELSRVAEKYFVQTPNYWFPIEPHCMFPCFHWLPKPIRLWLVLHCQLGHWSKAASIDEAVRTVESARLLNKKMVQALFPEAKILTERLCLLRKSFVAIRT